MKRLVAMFCLCAVSLIAATETATITVPNAQASELATVVELWIQTQVKPDGSLKYPGMTVQDRRSSLLDSLLRKGVQDVIRQACGNFPAECPTAIKNKIAARKIAGDAIDTEVDLLVQLRKTGGTKQ